MEVLLGHGIAEMSTDSLRLEACQEAMSLLSARMNNDGEIDGSGLPNVRGLCVGDYLDGIDLSAIPAHGGGTAGQPWNDTYKNNRIALSGFNTYKGMGNSENTKNHILFTFRNIPLQHRISPTATNTGGYPASELRVLLEGANGDGTGPYASDPTVPVAAFLDALKAQLGDCLYTIRKNHSEKDNNAWNSYTLWPPSELEVFGAAMYGDEGVAEVSSSNFTTRVGSVTPVHFLIFRDGYAYRIKHYNGVRNPWWELTPTAGHPNYYTYVTANGTSSGVVGAISALMGVAPAFCIC